LLTSTAARLADHVFPAVPVRQWVLSAPFELRLLLARNPEVLTALSRLFIDEISRCHRAKADARGVAAGRTGAVTFVQRFGGSMNLHVHLHVVVPDGVFTREPGERAIFHAAPAPTPTELATVVARVASRMVPWLSRHGHLEERDDPEANAERPAGWLQLSLAGGVFAKLNADGEESEERDEADSRFGHRARGPMSAEAQGFSLHAGVQMAAADREGRERLFRYCARPALSQERFSMLPDGRVAYGLKKPGRRGATHRVMEPLELMARLAALVPPPWHPLTRFHGVLAPHHAWRSSVVLLGPPPRSPRPRA
jgi:hypothetical protein